MNPNVHSLADVCMYVCVYILYIYNNTENRDFFFFFFFLRRNEIMLYIKERICISG